MTKMPLGEIETQDGVIFTDLSLDKDELESFIRTVHTRDNVEPSMYLYWGGQLHRVFKGKLQKETKRGWKNLDPD